MKDKSTISFNKIFVSGLVVAFICIFLLTGTTYAWFTMSIDNSENTIQTVKLGLSVKDNINNIEYSTLNDNTTKKWLLYIDELNDSDKLVNISSDGIELTFTNTGTIKSVVYFDNYPSDLIFTDNIDYLILDINETKSFVLPTYSSDYKVAINCVSIYTYEQN